MIDIDFAFYLQLFLRRLHYFLAVALLVAVAGTAAAIFMLPTVYRATAKILVETPQIPADLARSTVPTGSVEQLQIIQEDVLSRENLIALAHEFHLYENDPPAEDDLADAMKGRIQIVPGLVQSVGGDSPATIYFVSFDAATAKLSADVANRLVQMILDKDVELRTGRAADTVRFFTQEVTRLTASLKDIDAQILAFKNAHIDALPDSLEFRRGQQADLEQQLLQLSREETTLHSRQADLEAGLLSAGQAPATPEEKTLADLREALSQQSLVFSPDSPTIKALRSRIDTVTEAMRSSADKDASGSGQAGSPLASQPVSEIRNRLAAIEQQRAGIGARNDELSRSILATPANETALNELLRNRQSVQAQYDAAVSRLADATTGQQIEMRLKGQRLSLIESAVPPKTRLGPKRQLIYGGIAGAALAAGLAVVVLPEFLNRTIRRPVEMVGRLGIKPMVTIPFIPVRRARPWRRIGAAFAVLLVGIALPFLAVALGSHLNPPAPRNVIGQAEQGESGNG
jgi:uncharacterized protein involved in exopolysaccharide biosynthesis